MTTGVRRLAVVVPCYGPISPMFLPSLVDAVRVFAAARIPTAFEFLSRANIPRLRNMLASRFLRSDGTHLLQVDADQEWDPRDVVRWLGTDLDVVGAPIRIKVESPEQICCCRAEPLETREGYVKANKIGTGMLLTRRRVFEKMKPTVTEYVGDEDGPVFGFFENGFEERGGRTFPLGEDVAFLRRAQALGFDAWIDPTAIVTHWGPHPFDVSDAIRSSLSGRLEQVEQVAPTAAELGR